MCIWITVDITVMIFCKESKLLKMEAELFQWIDYLLCVDMLNLIVTKVRTVFFV